LAVPDRITETSIAWADGIRGPQHFDRSGCPTRWFARADGSWLYMLPSAIDDAEMGVSDVLRERTTSSNTATQVQMFKALGAEHRRACPCRAADRDRRQAFQAAWLARVWTNCARRIEPEALVALLRGWAHLTRSIRRWMLRLWPPASTWHGFGARRRGLTKQTSPASMPRLSIDCRLTEWRIFCLKA